MKRKCFLIITAVIFFGNISSCSFETYGYDFNKRKNADLDIYLNPNYWKQQALNDIIPFWEKTRDKKNGGYFTDVMFDGTVDPEIGKYPRMLSRIVYGFSTAYLLSGDDKYLEYAGYGLDYLTNYGWDRVNGGWHEYIHTNNTISNVLNKNLFDETYGNLGPTIYYFVTGDKNALSYVEKTHYLIDNRAWDTNRGGYYAMVSTNWMKTSFEKSFNSQIDTCTAYLIYYYLATRDNRLLIDLTNVANVVINHMIDPETGFVGERFGENWFSVESNLIVGHNLKTGWVLMRIYWLTGNTNYANAALGIADVQLKRFWDKRYWGWIYQFISTRPEFTWDYKDWWTQTEGNFLMLNLYHLTANQEYLQKFKETAYFWDTYMLDHKYKDVNSTARDGESSATQPKGNLYKSAYHTMEHAPFNYLYLSFYVRKTDAEIYFRLSTDRAGEKHYVKPVEDRNVILKKVEIDGKEWKNFNAKECYITLPKGVNMKVKVVLSAILAPHS